jgi:hypothetical protein
VTSSEGSSKASASAAALSAISALLSIPAYPFWSLCIFALAIIVLHELAKAPERRTLA